ncbi:MAG TPA: hypothetical protein VK610_04305, partial [Rhodothermales bacterium]|nr:hypothetical protein [Rhodothermales bacterium]
MPSGTLLRALPLLAVLVLGGCATAHYNRSALTADPVESLPPVRPATLDQYDARYPDADAVFIRLQDTREHVFEPRLDRWEYVRDRFHQYVVLDPEEEWVSTLTFGVEQGGTLEGVFSRVTSPDGTVRTFGVQDFVRERDEDGGWEYRIAYPGIERGSLIEERFRTRMRATDNDTPPLYEDIPLQRTYPVDSLLVRLVYPEGWGLQVKAIGQGVFPPYLVDRTTLPGNLLVQVDLTNVSPVPDEAYAPHFKEQGRYLEILVTGVETSGVEYHAPTSWEELGQGFARYAFRRGSIFGDPAARQAGRIIEESAPDSTRLAAIVTWVQENIEMGEGGDSFAEVLDARRGDPLFITGLTQAMLVSSGLDAEYLMIHPATEGYFDRAFVTGAQLPIPAVGVRMDGELRVVFPYLRGL